MSCRPHESGAVGRAEPAGAIARRTVERHRWLPKNKSAARGEPRAVFAAKPHLQVVSGFMQKSGASRRAIQGSQTAVSLPNSRELRWRSSPETHAELSLWRRSERLRTAGRRHLRALRQRHAGTRGRREDIPPLVWAFTKEFGRQLGKVIENVPRQSMEALQGYSWPGNVRELRNVIERSMILTDGPTLRVVAPDRGADGPLEAALTLAEVERRHIVDVLGQTGWRISGNRGAARILAVKPTTLEYPDEEAGHRADPSRPQGMTDCRQ